MRYGERALKTLLKDKDLMIILPLNEKLKKS
jgi:hypothetical protein